MKLASPPDSCKVQTPSDLALAIVTAVGDSPTANWLEPSHGKGHFVRAISGMGVPKDRLIAIDLDPVPGPADDCAQTERGVDFLRWCNDTDFRFDRIVGNPPYVSIKHLKPSLRKSAAGVIDFDGGPIGLSSNTWYAFVLSSIRLLRKGGTLAFVLPSAAEFANYSEALRKSVGTLFEHLELYRCSKPLFDGVQEGTLVAIARNFGTEPRGVVREEFDSREDLIASLRTAQLRSRKCRTIHVPKGISTVKFGSVATIRLGGVTGHAAYFLMNEERRQELGLPSSAMTKVVSRAKHLRFGKIDRSEWNKLKNVGERVWLFNPNKSALNDPSVKRYLDLKAEDGGCNIGAYKVSIRDPWYQTPLPERSDAFMSGMSQVGPRLTINEMKGLSATNTLYVISFEDRNPKVWYKWALAMLTSHAQKQISRLGRRYADGLIKFEPGSIGEIDLPILREDLDYEALYERAIEALLASRYSEMRSIGDSARI